MKTLFSILIVFLILNYISTQDFISAIEKSRKIIEDFKSKELIPGLVIGINYKGKQVWVQSFGYSDIENEVEFRTDAVVRTGSVSKPINTALVAKLVEEGSIEWDVDIHKYVSEKDFPKKQWKGEEVNITVRQLITMTAGIRTSDEMRDFRKIHDYHNVTQTLAYFSADPLLSKPGTQYYYSNFGWHLIGAVMESVTHQNFEVIMNKMFAELGMNSTQLSRSEQIIPHRSRQYTRTLNAQKKYVLHSAAVIEDLGRPLPWLPMGAVITSVPDLLRFTHIMLSCYKSDGYLKSKTVRELWAPTPTHYGMGWFINTTNYTFANTSTTNLQYVYHTGSVAGTMTMLGMIPELNISVAMISNLGGIQIDSIALSVLKTFVSVVI